jgi:asparagine synthase (glutamine-hydrolysing)
MCGIYGVVSLSPEHRPDPRVLEPMAAVTVHRGPDDEGRYAGKRIALGMRRLSIIDVDGGHQPISNAEQTVWVVCNGEIYNFRELRGELIEKGCRFQTRSDTEVIVHAYAEYGDRFLERLRGMFGIALWDTRRGRLILARDRLGIKPLYYLRDGERLLFASEAKAILAAPGIHAEIDPTGLRQYLSLGYVPAPYSMFRGIRKLPVASTLVVQDGETEISRYWELPRALDEETNERRWIEAVLDTTERAVASQMVSDVPIGAFLSGGIDSSAVVSLMSRHSPEPVKTYSIGFDSGAAGQFYNELPFARSVAEKFGTTHKEILVRPNVVQLLPKLLWQMDEPVADSAFVTTFLVAEFARRDVKVILSGVGGDELFGGYFRYLGEHYGGYYRKIPRLVRERLIRPLARRLPADRHSALLNLSRLARGFLLAADGTAEQRYRSYIGVFDDAARERLLVDGDDGEYDALARAFASSAGADSLRTLFEVDLQTQLPDDLLLLTDRMTMATSLECRVPLLDEELVELSARMPARFKIRGRELKFVLKRALSELLPREILYRKKRGFGAPMGAWIKGQLRPLTHHLLSRRAVERRGLFRPAAIERTLALHEASKEDHTDHILGLMNLEIWCRMYLDGRSPEDLTHQIEAESRS